MSAVGVEFARRAALRHDWLDVPNERSSHVQAIPRTGGLALVGAVGVAWAAAAIAEPSVRLVALPLGALIIAAVSWVDDLRTMPAGLRFAAHGLAATILLIGTGGWTDVELPAVGTLVVSGLGIGLAALWVVGLTNVYNFMDGIDGIAGGQAVVAGIAWAVIGLRLDVPTVALVGALVAGAAAGFLIHNWPPARIFMGDVGAVTLGFVFAALPLVAADAGGSAETAARLPLAGVLIVWPFLFDASLTLVRRAYRRENVFAAHRSHLYQRLVASGWTHRQTTGLYVFLAAVSATAGVAWALGPDSDVGVGVNSNVPLAVLAIAALAGVPAVLVSVVARSVRQPNRAAL